MFKHLYLYIKCRKLFYGGFFSFLFFSFLGVELIEPNLSEAASFTLSQTIPNPAATSDDEFGFSVAEVSSNILVGARLEDPGGVTDAGSVYLFDGTTGALRLTIDNPAAFTGDRFGHSVAGVGSNILVGAPLDNPGGGGGVVDAGSVYLFTIDYTDPLNPFVASTLTIPNPAAATDDRFGFSVAAVGSKILVGAPFDDPEGVVNAGSVYLFDPASLDPTTPILTIPNPAAASGDLFGGSVAAVGSKILVGAFLDDPGGVNNAGSVYLFDPASLTPTTPILTIPNPAPADSDFFGISVAAVGSKILVGADEDDPEGVLNAGSVYLFNGTTGALLRTIPNPAAASGDQFGFSVAGVGNNILVGANLDAPGGVATAGSVYLFDGTTGALRLTIPNPAAASNDQFGASVAGVGSNKALVGATHDTAGVVSNAGSAYLYNISVGNTFTGATLNIGAGRTVLGEGDVFFSSVDVEGDTTATLTEPNSALAANSWHAVTFNPKIFYNFVTTATGIGNMTFTFKIDPAKIPFGLGTADLRGAHDHGDGTFHILNGTFNGGDNTFAFTHDGGFSGYGVVVNPEPATLILLSLALLGLLPLKKKLF